MYHLKIYIHMWSGSLIYFLDKIGYSWRLARILLLTQVTNWASWQEFHGRHIQYFLEKNCGEFSSFPPTLHLDETSLRWKYEFSVVKSSISFTIFYFVSNVLVVSFPFLFIWVQVIYDINSNIYV
jgi:hypothetical protein